MSFDTKDNEETLCMFQKSETHKVSQLEGSEAIVASVCNDPIFRQTTNRGEDVVNGSNVLVYFEVAGGNSIVRHRNCEAVVQDSGGNSIVG